MVPKRSILVAVISLVPLTGCRGVLDPRGPVGNAEKLILIDSVAIMLVIVVPVILATIGFAWWFRAGNARAAYRPDWAFSGHLELIVWAIPALVITFLGGIAWFGSQALDPYKALASRTKAIEIEVISLDWKWLFIYPESHVAAVNVLVIPTGTPIQFRLTSSGVMNSFFVPQLGSQIYTMAGMTSQLSLQADSSGDYQGLSTQFSGDGFSDMHFSVRALPAADFAKWVSDTQTSVATLDEASYMALARPSKAVMPMTYKLVTDRLFDRVIEQTLRPASDIMSHPELAPTRAP
jgi:cytochrome o ubiquinol oxidase subunit II